ncbi:hypothetical protein TRICI_002199 [Trichomonascus ciferrii]|uniref:V-type proton ATPase subunit F n=1 Tax=Trichomonascus ciferrii TaxID=44093 RepID=A0A642V7E0_9ASCO|nr:hypothetical protein TRICI_002199 [Trichomonascus ciferrii]
MASSKTYEDRTYLAVIGDEDSVTGLLLAGIGNVSDDRTKNFTVVDGKTSPQDIEKAFDDYINRKDIAVLLINQHIAEKIRFRIDTYTQAFPAVLEIPSKDHPYGKCQQKTRAQPTMLTIFQTPKRTPCFEESEDSLVNKQSICYLLDGSIFKFDIFNPILLTHILT